MSELPRQPSLVHAVVVGDAPHKGCDVCDAVEAMVTLADTADWYRRCLEDQVDGRPVRNLDEARSAYDKAYGRARAFQVHWQEVSGEL